MYLSNGREPSPYGDGGGSHSYFVSRGKLMINPANIKICILFEWMHIRNQFAVFLCCRILLME